MSHCIFSILKNVISMIYFVFLSIIDFYLNFNKDLSLDAIVDTFYEIIYHLFNLFIPKTKIYSTNNYSPV
jgi:hypothetical protein